MIKSGSSKHTLETRFIGITQAEREEKIVFKLGQGS
jgi:hypothetical protein